MARPKKPATAVVTAPAVAPAGAVRAFPRRTGKDATPLTSEAIAADLDSFRKAGGEIEVLGTTRTLHYIGQGNDVPDSKN